MANNRRGRNVEKGIKDIVILDLSDHIKEIQVD
jgi:hypothetical protein